jgi:molybdenum cofactor cytidylyltransferase
MIDCIIPAAGLSQRMGRWKPLLPLFNKTIIEWSVFNAIAGGCRVILITGSNGILLEQLFKNNALVTIIENTNYSEGLLTSIKCGLMAVKTDPFFVSLADMPFISPDIFKQLSKSKSNKVIFPSYQNKTGHPVLIPSRYINNIYQFQSNQGLKPLLLKFDNDTIDVPSSGIHFDIDTQVEYKQAKLQAGSFLKKLL